MYYVYELVNLLGTVEWVGRTTRPKKRFYEHTGAKFDGNGQGKFHGRGDISMHIVASFETKVEALQVEYDLQIFWGLTPDRDKTKHCNQPKGSLNWAAKLTEEKVVIIKQMLKQGISHTDIAKKFNVGRPCISLISRGKSWTHVL